LAINVSIPSMEVVQLVKVYRWQIHIMMIYT